MAVKNFGIKMDEGAYALLKVRAKQSNVMIGKMIENFLGSFEIRLDRAYKHANIENRDAEIDRLLTRIIFNADKEQWDEKKFIAECENIGIDVITDKATRTLWTPKIELPEDDNDTKN
ncbi:MAG: hypothetical protein KQH63_18510 [Desulfobulbaceae bacterium]|nr:hypothetical protein [Desulfobulbaceae bacterium]